jgi:phosphopentomutase
MGEQRFDELIGELGTLNNNMSGVCVALKSTTDELSNTQQTFRYDREMAGLGVDKIGEYMAHSSDLQSQLFTELFAEMRGVNRSVSDMAKSVTEMTMEFVEHRTRTDEWRRQHSKDRTLTIECFAEVNKKVDDLKSTVNDIDKDVAVIRSTQKNNKELTDEKFGKAAARTETRAEVEQFMTGRNMTMFGLVAVIIGLMVKVFVIK